MTMNIAQVDDELYVGPQLAPDHMAELARAGIRSVINNRPDHEGGPAQPTSAELEAAARAAGLEYRYLPVPPAGQSEQDARAMVAAIEALPAPVLAFCRSGRRSLALIQLGRRLEG